MENEVVENILCSEEQVVIEDNSMIENRTENSSIIENKELNNIENYEEKNAKIEQNYNKNKENIFDKVKCDKKTAVYVKVNSEGYITNINSEIFIDNFDNWIKYDEGDGERYIHAQTCYFDKPLVDEFGKYNYKM